MLRLIPNEYWEYSATDAIAGLRAGLSPRHAGAQTHIEIPGLGPCVSLRSARAAIVLALKALALPPGASVAVPLYCCPVVLRAVDAAGYRARFIDIDPSTYCLSAADLAAKSAQVDAVIAVHMFGNMCDMRALREATPGKPIIEDCAQALGSQLNGRVAGSFSDIAVFSFRSGKYLSAGEGGAVYCANPEVGALLSKFVRELPIPGHIEECKHVAKTYLRSALRSQPLWGLLGNQLWRAYGERVSYQSQAPIVLGQVYESDRRIAVRRFSFLSFAIERQRSNADYYFRNLTVDGDILCSETPGAYFNRLQFPVCFPSTAMRERIAAYLQENGISTATPYKNIAAIAAAHYGYTGDCPESERVASRVLVIPCNYALKAKEIEHIASNLNRAWEHARPALRDSVVVRCESSERRGARTRDGEHVTEPQHLS